MGSMEIADPGVQSITPLIISLFLNTLSQLHSENRRLSNTVHRNWNLGIACSIWSMPYNDSKLQMPLFWRIHTFWSYRAFWKHGNATVQNWKHNWEDVLSNQIDWNCNNHNLLTFLLLDLFSKLITVILLLRSTIMAVSMNESHPKEIVVILIARVR